MKLKKLKNLYNNNFGVILSNTVRSFVYLDTLLKYKTIPKLIIIYSKKNINQKIKKLLIKVDCNIKIIKSDNVNFTNIGKIVLTSKIDNFIFSGYPGEIVKNKIFLNKINLIHSHSGLIPKYMGSTTIYYSILNEKKIHCSTFVMNKDVDQGTILLIKRYNLPRKHKVDNYDHIIRAKNLISLINQKNKKLILTKNNKKKYSFFYKAHPVLRNLANKKLI